MPRELSTDHRFGLKHRFGLLQLCVIARHLEQLLTQDIVGWLLCELELTDSCTHHFYRLLPRQVDGLLTALTPQDK